MHLDFLRPHRRASAWGWLLLAVSLLAVALLVDWRWRELEPQLQAGDAELRRLQSALSARQGATPRLSDEQVALQWTAAANAAQDLATPWAPLFAVLEDGANGDVALQTLEPDGTRHELLLTGEARNYAALLDYFRYLQDQPLLSAVALQTHQVNRLDRDKPVRFRITAHWEKAS
jgi:Tfp pilus assembly protein PilN